MGDLQFPQTPSLTADSVVHGLRDRFPVLQQHIQGGALAYLDNAATTQMPRQVVSAMRHFLLSLLTALCLASPAWHQAAFPAVSDFNASYTSSRLKRRTFLSLASS